MANGDIDASIPKPIKASRLFDAIAICLGANEPVAVEPTSVEVDTDTVPSRSLRILLAEDNLINQKVACKQLESLGFSVQVVANGNEVLAAMDEQPFDVVLMDCQMPLLDGYAATQEIRQREGQERHTIVIAMTASALAEDRDRCIAVGMDDFISKPVRREALKAVLERWEGTIDTHSE